MRRDTVNITIHDTSTGGQARTIRVDPAADGVVVVDINGYDVAGIDLRAGTVGAWDGSQYDPDNREWKVVDRFEHPVGTKGVGEIIRLNYVTTVYANGTRSHFRIDPRGELVETVDEYGNGEPDWSGEGICDPHRGGDAELQAGLRTVLERLDAADEADSDGEDGMFDLEAVAVELRKRRILAVVEDTAGNTACLFAGNPNTDSDGVIRYPVMGGPGFFIGPGWTGGRAWYEEFSFGPHDDGVSEHHGVPDGATPAQIADLIAPVVERLKKEQFEKDYGRPAN